jgi:cell division protein FtsA
MEKSRDIVVALDIGTTKICALAGMRDEDGRLEVLGVGKVASTGVMRGVVTNIDKTVQAIREAIDECSRRSGVEIGVVNVGIAGQHIKSLRHRGILMRDHHNDEITQADVDKLINDMTKLALPAGEKILHVFPQEFTVDYEEGILEPVGMSGSKLEANFHIVTGQVSAIKNIYKCVEKCGLNVDSLTLEPVASALSVLQEDEMELGVALVDIGGGTTDVTIYHNGIIRHTAVLTLGGNIITNDIKEGCGVLTNQAETLKVKHGSALASEVRNNVIITIPGLKGREPKEIYQKSLAKIIQARVEEVFDRVFYEIEASGLEGQLAGGIVITGGGSLLNHIKEAVELRTGMSVRIGAPVEKLASGFEKGLESPIYATGLGLLLKGFQDLDRAKQTPAEVEEKRSWSFGGRRTDKTTETKSRTFFDRIISFINPDEKEDTDL